MTGRLHYYIHGFELILHPESYTVEARTARSSKGMDSVADLPQWVFDPNHTIWFLEKAGSNYQRALVGEKIKNQLYCEMKAKQN